MTQIARIDSIASNHAEKLKSIGITTVEGFLEVAATPAGRKSIAKQAKLSEKLVLKWANHADLFRIKGIAGLKAELLEASGVVTMAQLAKQKPDALYEKMLGINDKKKLVLRVPGIVQVKKWVATAKRMKRVVR